MHSHRHWKVGDCEQSVHNQSGVSGKHHGERNLQCGIWRDTKWRKLDSGQQGKAHAIVPSFLVRHNYLYTCTVCVLKYLAGHSADFKYPRSVHEREHGDL